MRWMLPPAEAMNAIRYTIEVWPHGWTLSGQNGIPASALGDCIKLFPKSAVIDNGIASHLRRTGHPNVVMTIGIPNELKLWRAEIVASLADMPKLTQWWLGVDVGLSSAAIFAVFSSLHQSDAANFSNGAVPLDSADFGRCMRLIEKFPEWRDHLNKVADAYPETKWPSIVARWDELEKLDAPAVTKILASI